MLQMWQLWARPFEETMPFILITSHYQNIFIVTAIYLRRSPFCPKTSWQEKLMECRLSWISSMSNWSNCPRRCNICENEPNTQLLSIEMICWIKLCSVATAVCQSIHFCPDFNWNQSEVFIQMHVCSGEQFNCVRFQNCHFLAYPIRSA